LFWPTIVGRILLRGSSEAPEMGESIFDDDVPQLSQPLVPLACFFLLLGSVSSPLVRWIKSMICREREWLADAAAVQFTRNPPGIEGALKKIGGLLKAGRLDTAHAESASHFYFVNCRHESWFGFFSTHPPGFVMARPLDRDAPRRARNPDADYLLRSYSAPSKSMDLHLAVLRQ